MAASSTPASEPPEPDRAGTDESPPAGETGRLEVEVAVRQSAAAVDAAGLAAAVRMVLAGEARRGGRISLAVVDDATIHELNARYLGHDYPTDVLSFVFESRGDWLEGEIVVSAETAAREAARYGWPAADELLLYAVHGALHLAGYDDLDPAARRRMQRREAHYLQQLGRESPPGRTSAQTQGASSTR